MTAKSVPQGSAPAAPATALVKPIPDEVVRRHPDITEAQWRTLRDSLFPNAQAASVAMVLDYCAARRLDPMKKPCHIVPIRVRDPKTDQWSWKDVVMPGIYEHRITATRSGLYLGHSKPVYGPHVEFGGVTAPEWCEMTMYRHLERGSAENSRMEFPVRVYFREAVGLARDGKANERWAKAPFQMLTKCTEAAGLREAFPDSLGGEQTFEEMVGQDGEPVAAAAPIKPAQRLSAKAPPEPEPEVIEADAKEVPLTELEPEPEFDTIDGPIGVIVRVIDRSQEGKYAAHVILDTGFVCATRDQELALAADKLKEKKVRVELVTKPSRDPSKFAPWLEAIEPCEAVSA